MVRDEGHKWRFVHTDGSAGNDDIIEALVENVDTTGFFPVQAAIRAFDAVHDLSGMPWWATLPLSAIAIRTACLPLTMKQVPQVLPCVWDHEICSMGAQWFDE